jgi:hypothetical protein
MEIDLHGSLRGGKGGRSFEMWKRNTECLAAGEDAIGDEEAFT